jgi:mRNA interferase MazF
MREYDLWIKFKEILNLLNIKLPFSEKEIWWVSFGINIGIEINGKGEYFERPAVIIKRFNILHAWVLPISRVDNLKDGIHVSIKHNLLELNSVVVLSQIQTISNERLLRHIGRVSDQEFKNIKDALCIIIKK